MKCHPFFGIVLALSSCVVPVDEEETESVEQAGFRWDKCDPLVCGLNAAELTNGFFHELNLDALPNEDGYSLVSASKNGTQYTLAVAQGKIRATSIGAVPVTLSGQSLIDLKLRLRKASSSTTFPRTYTYSTIEIKDVGSAQYWARRTDGQPTPSIETYELYFEGENSGIGAHLCRDGAEFVWGGDTRAMEKHHAVVFEGDRIDVQTLSVNAVDVRWFNIGCAETALAKMQLNGHTHASLFSGLPFVPRLERQTFLKMITADYCGTGRPFTVSGQRLRWHDDNGTMTIASNIQKTREARWDEHGVLGHATPGGQSDAGRAGRFPGWRRGCVPVHVRTTAAMSDQRVLCGPTPDQLEPYLSARIASS
jgi:ADYC domain